MSNIDNKWKLIKSKPVFKTKWLTILKNDYVFPGGKVAEGYYHLSRPDYVLLVAIDSDKNIIVEKNYRRGVDNFIYELPAGWIDDGETPQQAAKRELKEETGYVAHVDIVAEIYAQPGFSSMKAYVALAKIDKSIKGMQIMGIDENIKYELINMSLIKQMIIKGEIKDMGFLSAFQVITARFG